MALITTTTLTGKLYGFDIATAISGNGRYAFYTTRWNVERTDPHYFDEDIFRIDLQTNTTIQVSHKSGLYGANWYPGISEDGQVVAYTLLEDSRNDIAVTNLNNGSRSTVSLTPAGQQDNGGSHTGAAISADGHVVAFQSDATTLTGNDKNGWPDIFVKNLQTGALVNASTTSAGVQLTDTSHGAQLSADGHLVVFASGGQVYVKNLQNGALTLASANAAGQRANSFSGGSLDNGHHDTAISDDGRYVVFASDSSNLVGNDSNGRSDVFRKDLQTGEVLRVSTGSHGEQFSTIQQTGDVAISADGRYVAFQASISEIAGSSYGYNLYLKDLQSGAITLVAPNTSATFSLSSDGHKLVYLSAAPGTYDYGMVLATVSGDFGSNTGLTGTTKADKLTGTAGNDQITGGGGNDSIDGGAGLDTAIYAGKRANFTIAKQNDGSYTVTDKTGVEGTDTLVNVERLQFADVNVALDGGGTAGQAYRIYQAAFNRAPDQRGLGYWIAQMDKGATLGQVADGFLHSTEGQKLFGTAPTNAALVNSLYQNVLHRAGDAGGAAYWNDILDSHRATQAEVLGQFAESAENKAALVGVVDAGMHYLPY